MKILILTFIPLFLISCSGIDLRPIAIEKPSDRGLVRPSTSSRFNPPEVYVKNPTEYCKMSFVGQNGKRRSSELQRLVGKSFGAGAYTRIIDFDPLPDRFYTITVKFERIDGKASSGLIDTTFYFGDDQKEFVIKPETYPKFCDERLRRRY